MNFNYTLKYRTFESLLEDVRIDLKSITTEGTIDPAQLIKVAMRVNYDLGMRIFTTKERVLDIENNRVRLPEDFYVMNFALLCGGGTYSFVNPQGTNIQEVVPTYRPWVEAAPCTDVSNKGESVCLTKCGNAYQLIQVIGTTQRSFSYTEAISFKNSQFIDCDCPNLSYRGRNSAYIKDGWIYFNLDDHNANTRPVNNVSCTTDQGHPQERNNSVLGNHVYLNYQGTMVDDDGELLIPDHPMLNEYYEYAVKKRILENMVMDGANVTNQLQLVMAEYRTARNYALSIVNTPNFSEMLKVWAMNRKAMYSKYYDSFKSYFTPTNFDINNAV
jgi:hypothetical protein